jgi:hypothetical protein
LDYSFIAWLEEIKFSNLCGDLAGKEKNTHVQVYQIRILEINQMRAYCRKTIRKITIFEKYSRNRRISS